MRPSAGTESDVAEDARRTFMAQWDTVAIIGVGLIGGSVGLALRERGLARRVVGIGRRPESLEIARRRGALDEAATELAAGVAAAELIVVCTPVGRIVEHVRQASRHCRAGALITDAGSTKAEIVQALGGSLERGVRFVGSHPLAGSEKTGPAAARADLFEGRLALVTPSATSEPRDVQAVGRLWEALGARVQTMPPDEHDRRLAATSHLPHLAAAALALITPRDSLPLVASGWLDTTRVAAGDVELWAQIFRSNRGHLLQSLAALELVLAEYRQALADDDAARLTSLLTEAKRNRDAVGS